METNQPNPRHVEILAEEAAKDPQNEHFLSATGGDFEEALKRLPYMQFILSGRSIISAIQRAVDEETASLRTELERVKEAVRTEIDYYDAGDTSTIDKLRILVDWKPQQTEGGGDGLVSMPEPNSKRNWEEDYQYENGNYLNECTYCYKPFLGIKNRTCCKICYERI
jgi:hypothetical protein